MKKIIDIPDNIVKDLKIMAVKDDTNLKSYIQDLISNHYHYSNITELTSYALDDGQITRSIWNYLLKTFEGLKNEQFTFDEYAFTDRIAFLQEVKDTCELMIDSEKEDKKDNYGGENHREI